MGARGEATIPVSGRDVRVLLTNRAIMAVEDERDKAILDIVQADQARMRFGDVEALLRHGMQAANREDGVGGRVTRQESMDIMDTAGFMTVAEAVITAAADVLAYEPDDRSDPGNA